MNAESRDCVIVCEAWTVSKTPQSRNSEIRNSKLLRNRASQACLAHELFC